MQSRAYIRCHCRSRRIGFDTFIVELAAPYDDETMTSLIETVKPMVETASTPA